MSGNQQRITSHRAVWFRRAGQASPGGLAWTLGALALLALTVPGAGSGTARGAGGDAGEQAPDFPPGAFSDGGQYRLADFRGKLLVLFFYEQDCPTCRGTIPARNAIVQQFRDKPVKFIAIGASDPIADVKAYVNGTKLAMPAYADSLGIMERQYLTQKISLNNIYQIRVIGPDGRVIGYDMTPQTLESALGQVKWKYKEGGYDPRLNPAIELLEWNQWKAGVEALKPWLKNKSTAESAQKLWGEVKKEGQAWKAQADATADSDPPTAYDLYGKIASVFAGDELGKAAAESLKKLSANKAVKEELAAREMYSRLGRALTVATDRQRGEVAAYCQSIAARYPDAPTAKRAAELAEALAK